MQIMDDRYIINSILSQADVELPALDWGRYIK